MGQQLAWYLGLVAPGRTLTNDEIEAHFAASFLQGVTPEKLAAVHEQISAAHRSFSVSEVVSADELHLAAIVRVEDGTLLDVTCSVEPSPPHLLCELWLWPHENDRDFADYVVVLNGVSSSGKSSIAKELQALMDRPWLHVQIDDFFRMLPLQRQLGQKGSLRLLQGAIKATSALAHSGVPMIFDTVLAVGQLSSDAWGGLFAGVPVLLVGVHAPLEVLEEREKQRGDRYVGQAKAQLAVVHEGWTYGLELDTSTLSAAECALAIKERVGAGPGAAFEAMQAARSQGESPSAG